MNKSTGAGLTAFVFAVLALNIPIMLFSGEPKLIGAWGIFSMGVLAYGSSACIAYFRWIEANGTSSPGVRRPVHKAEVLAAKMVRFTASIVFRSVQLLGIASIVYGAYVFASQCYGVLTNGNWVRKSTIDVIEMLGCTWAADPKIWNGLWRVLDWIPSSISLSITGAFIVFMGSTLAMGSRKAPSLVAQRE